MTAETNHLPTPRAPRYHSLDFWRGVACLMIVVVHSQSLSLAGIEESAANHTLVRHVGQLGMLVRRVTDTFGVGVPLFFVISGYCIAASCDSARRRPRSFAHFCLRRYRRIFPPYWTYLVLICVLCGVVALLHLPRAAIEAEGVSITPPWAMPWSAIAGTLLLTSTWQDRLLPPGGMMSGQAWSLCYEEQFYLIAGLLVWLAPRRFFVVVACISIAVLAVGTSSYRFNVDLHGFFFDGFWMVFAAGVLVYFCLNYASPSGRVATIALLAAATVAMVFIRPHSRWTSPNFYVAGFAFSLLLCGLHRWDRAIAASRLTAPISWCGRMCYSLYLIHYPIAGIVTRWCDAHGIRGFWPTYGIIVPIALALSIACAHAFAVLVERRFMSRQNREAIAPPMLEKTPHSSPMPIDPMAATTPMITA